MKTAIQKQLETEVFQFFENHSPKTFSRDLRRMLLDYLAQGAAIGFPQNIDQFLKALYDLFEILDLAEKYQQTSSGKT